MSDEERDDAYRAIGRYVVEFSRLVMHMRYAIERRLDRGSEQRIAPLALGEVAANQITEAFFAICEQVADLEEEEKRVGIRLRKEVRDEIKRRNDFAHGDWSIGEAAVSDDPMLYRVKPGRKAGPADRRELPVAEIDAAADDLYALRQKVAEYGAICLDSFPFALQGDRPFQIRHAFRMDDHRVVRISPVGINWL